MISFCGSKFCGSTFLVYDVVTIQLIKKYYLSCITDNDRTLWIGGVIESVTNLWKWSTSNRLITWTDWNPGKPQNSDVFHCMAINRNFQGRWNNHNCSNVFMHVCEFVMAWETAIGSNVLSRLDIEIWEVLWCAIIKAQRPQTNKSNV